MSRKESSFQGNHGLGVIRTIKKFREFIGQQSGLNPNQRLKLVKQAEVLIRDLYVHLPLKNAMHAIDPVQKLRLLKQRIDNLDDRAFHAELMDIFKELRDLHTNYSLPAPYSGRIAFLGILIERFFDNGKSKWMVSKIADHLVTSNTLTQGAEITHWNGMPMELAVWRNSDKEAGSNFSARLARGLESMTLRYLSSSLPPDEDWVDLTYEVNGTTHETRLVWQVYDSGSELVATSVNPSGFIKDLTVPLRYQVGLDIRGETIRKAKKRLFNASAVREEKRAATYKGKPPRLTKALSQANIIPTGRPDELTAKTVQTTHGTFGYLRLWSFHMSDGNISAFIGEVIRLLENEFPKEGLILDVRGNGGGYIIAAEFLLQLFTPKRIQPEPTQFIATASTLELTKKISSMTPWKDSLLQAVQTGAQFSKGLPLSPKDVINSLGQIYFSSVVLITDAYCYSACDMFAAGFQDHNIGQILGVDETTGAGGANVLTHKDLNNDWTGGPLQNLPGGASMRVSLRRTLRVGERSGQPVEDLGVVRDIPYQMTSDDLLAGNKDLINRAGELLSAGAPRVFKVHLSKQGQNLKMNVTTENVGSIDVYVNDRPTISSATPNGTTEISIPVPAQNAQLRINGFDNGELVASRILKNWH